MIGWLLILPKAVLTAWAMWYLYILVMGIYRVKLSGQLTTTGYVLALPAIVLAYAVDWLTNWTVATVWFRELPHKPFELVTARLQRYLKDAPNWRQRHAAWLCHRLLDMFDPRGSHCV